MTLMERCRTLIDRPFSRVGRCFSTVEEKHTRGVGVPATRIVGAKAHYTASKALVD